MLLKLRISRWRPSQNVKVRLVKVLKQDPTLVSKDAKDYAYIYFENTCEDIMTTSIILQIDYEYLGETFVKYLPVEFGYTDLLHESSILVLRLPKSLDFRCCPCRKSSLVYLLHIYA